MSPRDGNLKCGVRRWPLVIASTLLLSAVAFMVTGASLATFSSSSASQSDRFTAGTVTVSSNTSSSCSVSNMLPGASPAPCSLVATYNGTVSAYLAVDILIETQAGNGGVPLYNPSDSGHDIQV